MPDDVVGGARIHIEPDFTGFDEALQAGVQQSADEAAQAIVSAFRAAAETSASELATIGQAGFVDVTATAGEAGDDIGATFAAAADEADASLAGIGDGAAADIAAGFSGVGDEIADEFVGVGAAIAGDIEAGAADAQASLEGLGSGTGDALAGEFSGVGEAISSSVGQGADEASASLAVLEGTGQGVVENLAQGFEGLGGIIAGVAGGIALGSAFSAAEQVQSIAGVTNQLIETTGGVANVTAGEMLALGDSIERVVGTESELVQEAGNVLLTFKNVRNEVGAGNDIFDRAIRAGSDLSAVLGGEITGSALQMGKALQDPIRGVSLLGRAGVTFTAEQKELVRSLVEGNDVLAAQKIILDEVEGQVGGAAAASALASDRIRASLGNLGEELGAGLLPAAERLADRLPQIVEEVGPGVREIGEALGQGLELGVDALLALEPLLGSTIDLLVTLLPILEAGVDLVDAIPDPLLQAAAALVLFNKAGGLLGPTIANLRTVYSIIQAVAASRGISTAAAGLEALKNAGPGAGAIGRLRQFTTGVSGATAALGLGFTAITLYNDAMGEAEARGQERIAGFREEVDLTALSAKELANLSRVLGEEANRLRSDKQGGVFGATIDRDFNAELEAGAKELEDFQKEVDETLKATRRLDVEAKFGAGADRFFGLTDAIALVREESTAAADDIQQLRIEGDTSDASFLSLANTLDAAALSEEGMAAAAQLLGTDVESLRGFVESTTEALSTFIETGVAGLPSVADAFEDLNDDSKVSARELISGLETQAEELQSFLENLAIITFAGFSDVAAALSQQGAEVASTAAAEIANAAKAGNTELLEETSAGLAARDQAFRDSTAFLQNTLGPEYVIASGIVGANATTAFGENYDPELQVHIAMGLAEAALDEDGSRVAAIAATQGAAAATEFGLGLDMEQEAINAAVAAGLAIRENAPTTEARDAGVSTGVAFGTGLADGIAFLIPRVAQESTLLARVAANAARQEAQVESPSKVFEDIGLSMGEGMAIGIDEAAAQVIAAAEQIAKDAADAATGEALSVGARVNIDPSTDGLRAAALSSRPDDPGDDLGGGGRRSLVIEKLYLPATEPELAASAIIEGLVTITTTVGNV